MLNEPSGEKLLAGIISFRKRIKAFGMSLICSKCGFNSPPGMRFCGNCGIQLQSSKGKPSFPTETLQISQKELTRGIIFARRFEVIEKLGQGGMASVFRVVDKNIDEEVALKILIPEVASDEKTIERFRNELKFARKISHKNVCRMYDLNNEKGTQYITMEYVPGEDLKSTIIRVGQLSTGKAVSITKQICEGLSEAHRLGIVHRDMKPQNILFSQTDHWKNGLFTNGHNSISKSRDGYFTKTKNPYRVTDKILEDIVPKEVVEKIKAMGTSLRHDT